MASTKKICGTVIKKFKLKKKNNEKNFRHPD